MKIINVLFIILLIISGCTESRNMHPKNDGLFIFDHQGNQIDIPISAKELQFRIVEVTEAVPNYDTYIINMIVKNTSDKAVRDLSVEFIETYDRLYSVYMDLSATDRCGDQCEDHEILYTVTVAYDYDLIALEKTMEIYKVWYRVKGDDEDVIKKYYYDYKRDTYEVIIEDPSDNGKGG